MQSVGLTDLTFDTPFLFPEVATTHQPAVPQTCVSQFNPTVYVSKPQTTTATTTRDSGTIAHSTTDLTHPMSPKIRRTCVICSTLATSMGYGKVTPDKVYFDPSKIYNPTSFCLESFIYFMRHRCEGLIHLDLSYCPGCKGIFTLYSTHHSTQFIASILKTYLYSHNHMETK